MPLTFPCPGCGAPIQLSRFVNFCGTSEVRYNCQNCGRHGRTPVSAAEVSA